MCINLYFVLKLLIITKYILTQTKIKTLTEEFPDAKHIGCNFHWKQALRKRLLDLGVPRVNDLNNKNVIMFSFIKKYWFQKYIFQTYFNITYESFYGSIRVSHCKYNFLIISTFCIIYTTYTIFCSLYSLFLFLYSLFFIQYSIFNIEYSIFNIL
jgi:hypothetical protein